MTPPARLNTIISETVTATRTFGKSRGSLISAIKEGSTICPLPLERPLPEEGHEGISDVEHGAHASDKGRSWGGTSVRDDARPVLGPPRRMILNARENHPQDDRDEHRHSRDDTQPRKSRQRPRKSNFPSTISCFRGEGERTEDVNNHENCAKGSCADSVVGQRIQHLFPHNNVQSLDKDVIQNQA